MKIVSDLRVPIVVGLKKRGIECAVGHPVKGGGGVDGICLIEIKCNFFVIII